MATIWNRPVMRCDVRHAPRLARPLGCNAQAHWHKCVASRSTCGRVRALDGVVAAHGSRSRGRQVGGMRRICSDARAAGRSRSVTWHAAAVSGRSSSGMHGVECTSHLGASVPTRHQWRRRIGRTRRELAIVGMDRVVDVSSPGGRRSRRMASSCGIVSAVGPSWRLAGSFPVPRRCLASIARAPAKPGIQAVPGRRAAGRRRRGKAVAEGGYVAA
jgi:hypothetical protein